MERLDQQIDSGALLYNAADKPDGLGCHLALRAHHHQIIENPVYLQERNPNVSFPQYSVLMVLVGVGINSWWFGKLVWVEYNFFKVTAP